ncbi:hypothetical protein [Herbiconiux sp. YIM B11900]|uniref:hypothetical protein n=1 Tax=Herbiconiux sp. YIM B11900 TaxID=3404131 RepID=UPI003F8318EE
MQDWLPLLVPLIVSVIGGSAAYITTKINKRGTQENTFIDQLQEQQARSDAKIEALEKKVDDRDAAARKRERIRDDYIYELRDHIDMRKPPPPPPWPEGLTR